MPNQEVSRSSLKDRLSILWHRPASRESVIDGVRAIAILWVFVLHIVFFHFGTFPEKVQGIFASPWTQWMRQGTMGVDLFFVISGFLIGTILLREYAKTSKIDLRRFYARRFLRLIPVYVVVIFISIYFLQNIPKSAVLMDIAPSGNAEYLWTNLLYINNFVTVGKQYMPWCWSLAIEEQFYVIAPLFLLMVVGRLRKPVVWMLVFLALSGFIRLAIIKWYHFVPPYVDSPDMPSWSLRFDTIYDKLHVRYGGLLTGIIGAYLSVYHHAKLSNWFGVSAFRSTLVGVASLIVIGSIASMSFSSASFETMPKLLAQTMHSHHRDVFSVATMIFIFVAIYGKGLIATSANRLLSSPVLYPIAQLSYSIYLVHETIMIWVFPKTTPYFLEQWGWNSSLVMSVNGIIAILLALVISGALFIFVERPSMEYRKTNAFKRFSGENKSEPKEEVGKV
jgi:peptidoglycan/LPS O-acetylase OafA/YrhL